MSGELLFSTPLIQFSFGTTAVDPATSVPAWNASAYDVSNNLLSSVAEPSLYPGPAAQSFTLTGPGITRVVFNAFNSAARTFNGPPLDDIVLTTAAAPGCSATLTPPGQTFGAGGGPSSFTVNTAVNCNTIATSNDNWIILLPGVFVCPAGQATCPLASSATGTVQFVVVDNSGAARSGSISVGGQNFIVNEQGLVGTACTYVLSPSRATISASAQSVSTSVLSAPACQWSVVSNASWLTVASSASGEGNAQVTLRASANNTGATRVGTVTIGGAPLTVTQPSTAGASGGACGATDVTQQFRIQEGLLQPQFGSWNYYQTISVTNASGSNLPLPIFIVLVGEPTNNGYPNDSFLFGGGSTTKCFSPTGDYILLPSPQGVGSIATTMPPGQTATAPLVWSRQSLLAPIRYSVKVLSGTPTK